MSKGELDVAQVERTNINKVFLLLFILFYQVLLLLFLISLYTKYLFEKLF